MKAYYYIFLFLFLFSGCSSMYIPSPRNTPLLEEKGEVQIEAGASTNSFYATGSYAFSEKYAAIANVNMSFGHFSEITDLGAIPWYGEFEGGFTHRYIEAGAGGYNLSPSSTSRRLEAFAGTGYGIAPGEDGAKCRYLQEFVQVNSGRRFKHFEVGWSLYMSYAHFFCKYEVSVPQPGTFNRREMVSTDFGTFNIGPLIFLKFGGPRLKAFVREGFNLALPLSSSSLITTGKHNTIGHLSIGLSYRF